MDLPVFYWRQASARAQQSMITQMESCRHCWLGCRWWPTIFVRGGRLVVPYQPHTRGPGRVASAEASILHTRAVRTVVQAARSPIRCGELAGKLAAGFRTRRVGGR